MEEPSLNSTNDRAMWLDDEATDMVHSINFMRRPDWVKVVADPNCPPGTMYYVDPKNIIRVPTTESGDEEEQTFHTSPTGGRKEVKQERHSLIPVSALRALARHYAVGAAKYDDHNWRRGYKWSLSYDAVQRHLNQFWDGERMDEETGSHHAICAAWHCICLFVFDTFHRHHRFDDRYDEVNGPADPEDL
jgi:hypothetical protein